MTVLDAYAVIAFLREEPAMSEVEVLLREPTTLSAANQVEVIDRMIRVWGHPADDIEADLAMLADSGMATKPVDSALAVAAGLLRARHYHRESSPVSLADCITAATAIQARVPLATADPALAAMVRAVGGEVVALPDRRGRRP